MITTINEFKMFLENTDFNFDNFNGKVLEKLKLIGIENIPGEFEYDIEENIIVVLRAYLNEDSQRKGIGMKIYQALLDTALEFKLDGVYSPAFDYMGTQRTPAATALWNKFINLNGGTITDVSKWININTDNVKYTGPFIDYLVDGSHKIKNIKA